MPNATMMRNRPSTGWPSSAQPSLVQQACFISNSS